MKMFFSNALLGYATGIGGGILASLVGSGWSYDGWAEETEIAKEIYQDAILQYKEYALVLRVKHLKMKRLAADFKELTKKIKDNGSIIAELCGNNNFLGMFTNEEKNCLASICKYKKSIVPVEIDDICAFDEDDIWEIQEATKDVVMESIKLKNRIISACKKLAIYSEKIQICKSILEKLEWYKNQGGKK